MSASDVIARLRALRAKATAGRWESGALFDSDFRDILNAGGDNIAYGFASSGTGILRPQDSAAIVAAMNSLESLLACAAQLEKLTEAASCIRHWHDAMADGSGMVVSAEHVRKLWDATEQARRALQALAEGGGS